MAVVFVRLLDLKKAKLAGWLLVALVTVVFAGSTWVRSADWKNNFTLATATLEASPYSPRFNNMMGLELRAQKKNTEALAYFEKAVQSNPKHVPALVNLGTEYRNSGRHQEAAATLERALKLDPKTLATYVNLMSVYRSLEAYDKNIIIADQAVARFPQSAAVIWNAANAYHLKGDMEKANALRARAKAIDPQIGGAK
jgi:tetratricopeptide (TPR) repeat protein